MKSLLSVRGPVLDLAVVGVVASGCSSTAVGVASPETSSNGLITAVNSACGTRG